MPDPIRWQPISRLPLIASLVEDALANTQDQHQTFLEARRRPHRLDDATVERAIDLYHVQLEDLWLYEQQLARWQQEPLTDFQRQEVDRLAAQVPRIKALSEEILEFLEEIRQGTIDRIMEKSDYELGSEALSKTKKGRRLP